MRDKGVAGAMFAHELDGEVVVSDALDLIRCAKRRLSGVELDLLSSVGNASESDLLFLRNLVFVYIKRGFSGVQFKHFSFSYSVGCLLTRRPFFGLNGLILFFVSVGLLPSVFFKFQLDNFCNLLLVNSKTRLRRLAGCFNSVRVLHHRANSAGDAEEFFLICCDLLSSDKVDSLVISPFCFVVNPEFNLSFVDDLYFYLKRLFDVCSNQPTKKSVYIDLQDCKFFPLVEEAYIKAVLQSKPVSTGISLHVCCDNCVECLKSVMEFSRKCAESGRPRIAIRLTLPGIGASRKANEYICASNRTPHRLNSKCGIAKLVELVHFGKDFVDFIIASANVFLISLFKNMGVSASYEIDFNINSSMYKLLGKDDRVISIKNFSIHREDFIWIRVVELFSNDHLRFLCLDSEELHSFSRYFLSCMRLDFGNGSLEETTHEYKPSPLTFEVFIHQPRVPSPVIGNVDVVRNFDLSCSLLGGDKRSLVTSAFNYLNGGSFDDESWLLRSSVIRDIILFMLDNRIDLVSTMLRGSEGLPRSIVEEEFYFSVDAFYYHACMYRKLLVNLDHVYAKPYGVIYIDTRGLRMGDMACLISAGIVSGNVIVLSDSRLSRLMCYICNSSVKETKLLFISDQMEDVDLCISSSEKTPSSGFSYRKLWTTGRHLVYISDCCDIDLCIDSIRYMVSMGLEGVVLYCSSIYFRVISSVFPGLEIFDSCFDEFRNVCITTPNVQSCSVFSFVDYEWKVISNNATFDVSVNQPYGVRLGISGSNMRKIGFLPSFGGCSLVNSFSNFVPRSVSKSNFAHSGIVGLFSCFLNEYELDYLYSINHLCVGYISGFRKSVLFSGVKLDDRFCKINKADRVILRIYGDDVTHACLVCVVLSLLRVDCKLSFAASCFDPDLILKFMDNITSLGFSNLSCSLDDDLLFADSVVDADVVRFLRDELFYMENHKAVHLAFLERGVCCIYGSPSVDPSLEFEKYFYPSFIFTSCGDYSNSG